MTTSGKREDKSEDSLAFDEEFLILDEAYYEMPPPKPSLPPTTFVSNSTIRFKLAKTSNFPGIRYH
jgi:hypothetical protein